MTKQPQMQLLGCPFCGGEAEHKFDHTTEESHYVQCPRCCFSISRFYHDDDYLSIWNTRTPAEPLDVEGVE